MEFDYSKFKNRQLGAELRRFIDGNVRETPENVEAFNQLTREIARRLGEAPCDKPGKARASAPKWSRRFAR